MHEPTGSECAGVRCLHGALVSRTTHSAITLAASGASEVNGRNGLLWPQYGCAAVGSCG